MTGVQPPTAEEVRTRLGLPAAAVPDDELADVVAAEVEDQAVVCRAEPYGYALRQAVFRRCARAIAAKGVPLGILSDEFGQTSLRQLDAEIGRWEGPHRRFNLGTRRAQGSSSTSTVGR